MIKKSIYKLYNKIKMFSYKYNVKEILMKERSKTIGFKSGQKQKTKK